MWKPLLLTVLIATAFPSRGVAAEPATAPAIITSITADPAIESQIAHGWRRAANGVTTRKAERKTSEQHGPNANTMRSQQGLVRTARGIHSPRGVTARHCL